MVALANIAMPITPIFRFMCSNFIGKYSYANSSHIQRVCFNATKDLIKEVIIEGLDVKNLTSSNSNAFSIADLGCSVGPNTFLAMEYIIDAIEHKYHDSRVLNPTKLEFLVFFNDQVGNDFNTLFASLPPERQYFVAGVPGSFYGRLFPPRSIYLAYSSSSIHWLSQVPKEVLNKTSPAYNKGRIHYNGASNEVVEAYTDQFEKDMEVFLCARSEEIVKGGMIVIIMSGVPEGVLTHDVGIAFSFLESILIDMIEEGIVKQDEVDTFNIPHMYPSVKQMSRIVEKNGSFGIEKMELMNVRTDTKAPLDPDMTVMNVRAFAEGIFKNHFESKTVDEVFKRAIQQKSKLCQMLDSSGIEIGAQLFAVLKRL